MNAENDLKMWLQRVADSPEKLRPVDVVMRLLDPENVPNGCTLHGMVAWLMTQRVSDRVRTILVQWSQAHPESVPAQPAARGHTPGPWTIKVNRYMVCVYAGGFNVAAIGSKNVAADNSIPNARLIAAAPDLLAVCERLHKHVNGLNATLRATLASYAASELCGELTKTIKDAAAAIAKARGE